MEVQADVTSSQRFSLCSETASATTSLSEKSVNVSIAPDDASTRALAGSVLNMKLEPTSSSSSSNETTTTVPTSNQESSSGQATSLSSLEEMTANLAKRARRRPASEKQPSSEPEDTGSERVRFDHHVSFIDADVACASQPSGRKKKSKHEQTEHAEEHQRALRSLRRLFSR